MEAWQLKPGKDGAEPTRYKIAAGERHPLAWDRPMQDRTLVVQIAGMRELAQVKMEEFGEHKLPGELHAEVFADGHARALRVSDKGAARSTTTDLTSRSGGTDDDLEARYSLQACDIICMHVYICACVCVHIHARTRAYTHTTHTHTTGHDGVAGNERDRCHAVHIILPYARVNVQ